MIWLALTLQAENGMSLSAVPKRSILIVDDDPDTHTLLRKRLKYFGFNCASAYSVESALIQLKEVQPDLIILDLRFQKADGTVFLKNAKAWLSPNCPLPPVIVLSGCNDKEIVEHVLNIGAVGFIAKPYDPTVLLSMVHGYIRSALRPMEILEPEAISLQT